VHHRSVYPVNIHPDAVPPIHAVSYHVATDKTPAKDGDKVITTKLAAAIFGGELYGGGVLPAQYCPCGMHPRGINPGYARRSKPVKHAKGLMRGTVSYGDIANTRRRVKTTIKRNWCTR